MDSSTSMTQIAVKYNEINNIGKSVKKLSKSRKNLKGLKSCNGHLFGEMFTNALILYQRTWDYVKAMTVFQALFARL